MKHLLNTPIKDWGLYDVLVYRDLPWYKRAWIAFIKRERKEL